MKTLFTLLLAFCLLSARANNYYFSAVSGNDSRTPAQAQNTSTPWKSISKLNSYFNRLQPGDAVLFKRGETFYGSIIIHKSGTAGSPIVISAYGTGDKPLITSLVTLTNWISKGNGIWESYNPSLVKSLSSVLINGVEQQLGRYPNSDAPNKGYLTFESHVGTASITDNQLTSATNWKGAEVVIRSRRWVLDRDLITSQSGNTIHYKASSQYAPTDNYGYFIQNDIKTLDQPGEWYYNSSAKKLSVYFGSNAPSAYTVQATTIDNLISSQKYSNVVFDNLSIKGANSSGIYIKSGSGIHVSNCDIMFSGENGISAYFHANLKIENCTISNSNNGGINLGYIGDNATIRNNKILNTATKAGMGGSGDGKGLAIHSNGSGSIIEYNEIRNTGYIAISFNGSNVTVKNNFIDSFCTTKDDGSGIYTWLGSSAPRKGRKVIGNIVLNGIGVSEGTDVPYSAAEGIYMDNNTSYVDIRDNTVANCTNNGLFLHNANTLTIKNNTFYNNFKQLLASQDAKKGNGPIRNCIITNNNFFSKRPEQTIVNQRSCKDDISLFARFDSNYYNRPFADWFIISNSYYLNSGTRVNQSFDLQEWKAASGKDLASRKVAKQIIPYKLNSLTSSNKFVNGTFSTTMRGTYSSSCTASLSNSGLLDGGYLQVVPSAQSSSVFVNIGELKAGAKYILRYSVKGSVNNIMYVGASLRKAASPYTVLTPIQYRKVNFSRSENEILFTSSTNETSAQIVFKSDNQSKYYLDNIQLYEADASLTNIDDSVRFVYNATQVSKTVSLNGSYVDVKNNKYSNSIVLQPYQSAVLIKEGSMTNTVRNSSPTVIITSPEQRADYNASATINITAKAADTDGSIKKVAFYNDTILLGAKVEAPFTYSWKNVPAGNYTITAKATDNSGNITTSESVKVSVKASSSPVAQNAAPKVNITSPAVNESFKASATIDMSADASDADGTVKQVEFYNGTTLLHTERKVPYIYSWTNVPAGNYTIIAKATDNKGKVSTSAGVSVSVAASSSEPGTNAAPSVNITSPAVNAVYKSSATINISANASDSDGRVKKVEYYIGTTLLHTETGKPYSWDWRNVRAGNYTITAVAIDDKGAATRSASVTISVVSKNTSHRSADDSDTSVAVSNATDVINNDTTKVMNNIHSVNLRQEFVSKAKPATYDLKVFPNPAVNKIQISVDGLQNNNKKARLSITNLSGIIVKSMPVNLSGKTIEADVSSLSSGMYIVSIITDNAVMSRKILKN